MGIHRMIVIAVHVTILVTITLLLLKVSTDWPAYWALAMVYGPPIVALIVVVAPLSRKQRIVGLYVSAIATVPAAAFGIFGGWGLLYVIGIVFLLAAAWRENEGDTSRATQP